MKKNKEKYIILALIIATLLLLAFVDIIVVEKIYHSISNEHSIPFDALEATIFNKQIPILWWHLAFIPLAFGIFILLGIARKSYKLAISGIILFATGWEDIFYYLIQLKWLPPQLSNLDPSPLITLSRFITRTEHVTNIGVLISAIIGAIVVYFILFYKFKKKQ